nr:MAG TPA: zinc-ribbon domain protein [Caudoviricetes sp.]
MRKIRYPVLKRTWYKCPYCGTNLALADNTARCNGVFIKCKTCKQEIEINI